MQKKTFGIQNLPTVPARLCVMGNHILQTSTIQHMHSALGLPHVQPTLMSAVFKAGASVFVFWKQESFCREIYHQTSPLSSNIPHHTLMSEWLYQCPIRYANYIILQLLKNKVQKASLCFRFTSSEVNRTSLGRPESPFSFISGQNLYLAKFIAYILETEPPAKRDIQILY